MTREEREAFVRSAIDDWDDDRKVQKIVDEWENDAEQAFTRGQENVWESQGAWG